MMLYELCIVFIQVFSTMAKKKSQKRKPSGENPFNVKVNRSKFSVLGQKIKGTRGMPGISHAICNARRKEEFHKRRTKSQKSNKFIDKRFVDSSLSVEDQATLRLVEERKTKFKKNIFNLNDEVSLTHKGMPLENVKNLGTTLNDSDDDDDPFNAEFVKHAHFGGFTDDSSSAPKSHKEIIDDLILESKKRKIERKQEKERNEDLIEALDKKWKVMSLQLKSSMKDKNQKLEVETKDPFDILLKELKYEIRTAAPVREKSAEEIARSEKEKQQKLEEERLQRMMNPMDFHETTDNQLSADSLYDGLDIQFEPLDGEENGDIVGTNKISEDESSNDSEDDNDANNDDLEENNKDISPTTPDNKCDFPDTVKKFSEIVAYQSEELYSIVDSLIKDKVRSKSKQNVEKLESFFIVLIKYIMNSNHNISKTLELLDSVLPHLYTIAEISSRITADKLLCLLDVEEELFQQSKAKKLKMNFPRKQCLVLFKIISVIYSVSDFKHSVVTPALIFMCDVLSSAYSVTYQNIYCRLFICKIIYNCVTFSKRYVPEALLFLNKSLELALRSNKKFNLFISEEVLEDKVELNFEILDKSCNVPEKVAIISDVIQLLHKFAALYEHYKCFKEIFSPSIDSISKIVMMENFQSYPAYLNKAIHDFDTIVKEKKQTYKPIAFKKKKPVPLKLFEPAFESKFTKDKDDIQRKRKVIKNVNQKIKKEVRGQLREVRRNNQVIAAEKLKEIIAADDERKRKVKELYSELSMQEGEYKKFLKKK